MRNRLIVPSRYELGADLKGVVQSPKNWGLSLKKFSTTTQDCDVLPGWIVTQAPGRENLQPMSQRLGAAGIRGDSFRGTIVLLHGINSRKEHMLGICRMVNGAAQGNVISKGGEALMPEMVQFYGRHLRK